MELQDNIRNLDFATDKSLGAIFSPVDVRDYTLKICGAANFPESFELPMRAIKDQGTVQSCVAHSIAETIEYFNFKQEGKTFKMSTNYIYGNRRNSCYKGCGMILRDALKTACNEGSVALQYFPGNTEVPSVIQDFEKKYNALNTQAKEARFSSFFRIDDDDAIKTALLNNGPVLFAINWYRDIKVDANGIMSSTCDDRKSGGGHCMVIYGWDKNGWKIQNSWGEGWGKQGRAIMPYYFPIIEAWGVTDDIINTNKVNKMSGFTIKMPFHGKIREKIAKIINFFRRKFGKN